MPPLQPNRFPTLTKCPAIEWGVYGNSFKINSEIKIPIFNEVTWNLKLEHVTSILIPTVSKQNLPLLHSTQSLP